MKKIGLSFLSVAFAICLPAAQLPVTLNSDATFAALAGSTLTNTGPSIVNGNVGVSPGAAVTGFPPGTVVAPYAIHAADGVASTAQADLTTAYLDAAGRTAVPSAVGNVAGDLGGLTLTPGLYNSTSSLGITGTLTLNGQGNVNSVFIFQVASALTTASGSQVVLIGGAQAANIFWQVGSSATLGTYSTFSGTILSQVSITLMTGAVLTGRALARTGAVTMDTNTDVQPGPPVTGATPLPLTVSCPNPSAQVGVGYNSLLAATGGTTPYTFSISGGSLPPGLNLIPGSGAITGTPTGAGGAFPFTANVRDATANTASNGCTITTAAASADVSIVKTGPATVALNANITYNLAVANAGPSLAAAVTVTDVLPTGTTFVSATPTQGSCSGTTTVTCSLGNMGSGGVAAVALVVRAPGAAGPVSNTASVASPTADPNLVNNTSTWTGSVTAAAVPLSVTCPLSVAQVGVAYNSSVVAIGGTGPYTFSITSGSLPTGFNVLNTSSGAVTGTPTTTAGSPFTFTAQATDSVPNSASQSCSITVAAASADISIAKTGPPTSPPATNITYTLAVANAGPSFATSVIVSDILPAGTTFVSATPTQGTCAGTTAVSCSLGTIAASGSATVVVVVKSPSTLGTVSNTSTAFAATADPNLANNTSTTATTVPVSVPALSTWGLGLLALLLAGCSALFIRRAQLNQ